MEIVFVTLYLVWADDASYWSKRPHIWSGSASRVAYQIRKKQTRYLDFFHTISWIKVGSPLDPGGEFQLKNRDF